MHRTSLESGLESPSACILSAPVTVLAYPSPLRPGSRTTLECAADLNVSEIVDRVGFSSDTPWDLRVRIEGHRVPKDMWRHTKPNPGTVVTVRAVPHGGQTGKAVLQIVIGLAFLALAVIQPALLGLTPLAAFTLGVAGAASVVTGAISLAAPPPVVPFTGAIPSSDSRAIAAAQNEARPFAPVPRVFGQYRVFPQYAAKPYTEIVGNDVFLRLLFTFGYGPLQIDELRLGEDLVANFSGVDFNILPGFDDDPALSIFTNGVDEESFQIDLTPLAPAVTRTTELDTYESSVDFIFPSGLISFDEDDGRPRRVTAVFTIEFRDAGSADPWVGIDVTDPLGPGVSNPAPGSVDIDARVRGRVSRGIHWRYPSAGQWEVRVTRLGNATYADGTVVDDCSWTTLRSIRPGTAPRVPNLAMVEMRIRATDQLSGVVQNLSALCTSILPVWNAIDGWGSNDRLSTNPRLFPTRNPAWALAEMLRGGVNARPVPDENVDTTSLSEWALTNSLEGRNFDAVVDFDTTIGEICRDIAGSARASFNIIDGRYGVVVDELKPTIVAQFGSRDTSEFSATKIFQREVHGLRVRFVSPDAGYEPDERIVYADGFDETNSTEFKELDLWGVTDPDRAHRDGRYHLAAGKLRPEVYSFAIDVAQLIMTRGDRILYSHDVMLVGLGNGRIRSVLEAGGQVVGVEVDESINYDPFIAYAARIRFASTGQSTLYLLSNLGVETPVMLFLDAIDPIDAPDVDDLVSWGEAGKEVGDYIVHSIVPTADLGARIELIDYSPAIFDADTELIPPFDPNITDPRPQIVITPSRPSIDSVASDESVLVIDADGSFRPRIVITASTVQGDDVEAAFLQAQYRTTDPVGEWYSAPQVDALTSQISVENVDEGEQYDIRVRAISEDGRGSDWAVFNAHLVVGASTPPPDVTLLRVDSGAILVWDYPAPPRDFAGFKVRHQAGTDTLWATAIPAHDGLVTESRFDISALPPGERTILVKAFDTAGNESASPGVVVQQIGGLLLENLFESSDFHAAGFLGTITNATVEPGTGDLVADSEVDRFWGPSGGLFWGAPGDLFWGNSFKPLEYIDSWAPTAAAIPGRLFLDLDVSGSSWQILYRESGDPEWIRWPGFVDAEAGVTYEFRLTIDGGETRGRVSAFAAQIDKPDIEELLDDFVVAASGVVRLSLNKTFSVIKQVLLTVQDDGNGGVSARVIDKDATNGPSIEVLNASSTRVAGLIDARVRGYN